MNTDVEAPATIRGVRVCSVAGDQYPSAVPRRATVTTPRTRLCRIVEFSTGPVNVRNGTEELPGSSRETSRMHAGRNRRWLLSRRAGQFVLLLAVLARAVVAPAGALSGRWKTDGGMVTDRKTGLTWQRCYAGQRWAHGRCAGSPGMYSWDRAASLTSGRWRLPTPNELVSLVDPERKRHGTVPTFDVAAFLGFPSGSVADTWTAYRRDCGENQAQGCASAVTFGSALGADVVDRTVDIHLPVRLVSGTVTPAGPPGSGDHPAPAKITANGRFEVSGNIAHDRHTGLVWQRCDAGRQMTAELGCAGILRSYTREQALQLGRHGWRLPTLDELLTLVDPVRKNAGQAPYLDWDTFPAGPSDIAEYWTSTRYTASGDQLYCVNFHLGTPDNCGPYPQGVRLVRRAEMPSR